MAKIWLITLLLWPVLVLGDSVEKLGTWAGVWFFEGSRSCGGVVIGSVAVANYR